MTRYILVAGKYLLLVLVTFTSCSKRFSEVSLYSNLQQGDSISVAIYFNEEDSYYPVNSAAVTAADAARRWIDVPLPDSLVKSAIAISFTVHRCADSILAISAIQLNDYPAIGPQDIMNTLWWQSGLAFAFDSEAGVIRSCIAGGLPVTFPVGIYALLCPLRPGGIQLFLRLSLCAVLIFLIALLYKQSSTQRILLISVAFFIACFPLKMEWSNWTLGVMGLVSLIRFIADKERKFRWQTIFWIPTVTYVLYWIGILYAVNKIDAYKELDSSVAFLIFPIIFSMIQWKRDNINLLLRFFIRAMTVFCIFGIVSYATIVPEFTWNMAFWDSKLYASLLLMWPAYHHPSIVSMVLAMVVPVAVYLYQTKNISMAEMLLCMCCVMIFSILTGSRIAMVVVPVIIVSGFVIYAKIKPVFKWVFGGIIITGCIFIFNKYPEIQARFSDPARRQLRATAVDAFKQKPILGWGTGSMKQIIASEQTALRLGYDAPAAMLNHFHNQYLDSLVQFGIAGSLVFFALFIHLACVAVRRKDFLLAAFLAIYLLFMLVESPFATVKSIQPMMFWLCFFIGSQNIRI